MRERTAVGERRRPRRGAVSPAEGCRGGVECRCRSTPAPTPADGGADRLWCTRLALREGATPRGDPRPNPIGQSPVTPYPVHGQSNQALKRTAAGSGVPLSIGLAAA
jgi:hypothetical protein